MAAITVGDSSWPNCISDNPTPANGLYAIYMNPTTISLNWQNIFIQLMEVQNDNSKGTTAGGNKITVPLASCQYPLTVANIAILLMAQQVWSTRDLNLYLLIKDKDGTNCAVFPAKSLDLKTYTPRAYNAADFEQIQLKNVSMKMQIGEEHVKVSFNTVRSSL